MKKKVTLAILICFLLFVSLVCFFWYIRPSRSPLEMRLFPGVTYKRTLLKNPMLALVHRVTIKLSQKNVRMFSTPPARKKKPRFRAMKTSRFLETYKLDLAINGGFFNPFRAKSPWDYYPKEGDLVNVIGHISSKGVLFQASKKSSSVCFFPTNRVVIQRKGCPKGVKESLSGYPLLIQKEKLRYRRSWYWSRHPAPRTALATNKEGTMLWIFVVDGRQRFYSDGLSIGALASHIKKTVSPYSALNLDGGGSTTLVVRRKGKAHVLNSPIHTGIPTRQRPVGNHLGFFLQK